MKSVKQLSAEEKIRLLTGKDCWTIGDGSDSLTVSDGPLGLRKPVCEENGSYDLPAIAYPSAEVLSQTWDLSLAFEAGQCLADDCIERDVDILLAPGVNIKRSPLCGRNFEYFSEDPYLSGVFGREYIRGLQSKGVGASLKHYCANNQEFGRVWISSEVDERTLREIYLRPFEIACEAQPWTVMCSYNLLNGKRMAENGKLFRLLREDFGFCGAIVSDWGAVKDRAASVRAGLDVEMPFSESGLANLREAYARGEVTEEQLDACAERVLSLLKTNQARKKERKLTRTPKERLSVAKKVAEQGIVLLKNNGVLPIANGAGVAIVAEWTGKKEYVRGGGSSRVQPDTEPEPLVFALQRELPQSEVSCAGLWDGGDFFYRAFRIVYGKDVAVVLCGTEDGEGSDRPSMRLPKPQETLIRETARKNPNTVVVLRCGAAVDVSPWIDCAAAIVWAGYGGACGSEALAAILSGRVNPSGKLTETFAMRREDYPSERAYSDSSVILYEEGLRVGYRYFDDRPDAVRFPFGFGLSYSEFRYSDLEIDVRGESAEVSFRIFNASERDGAEVAQIYVHETDACVYRPQKELKAFARVFLKAGQTKTVSVLLPSAAFAYYSVAEDGWTVKAGQFDVLVGKSAAEIVLTKRIGIGR